MDHLAQGPLTGDRGQDTSGGPKFPEMPVVCGCHVQSAIACFLSGCQQKRVETVVGGGSGR